MVSLPEKKKKKQAKELDSVVEAGRSKEQIDSLF